MEQREPKKTDKEVSHNITTKNSEKKSSNGNCIAVPATKQTSTPVQKNIKKLDSPVQNISEINLTGRFP